MEKFRVLVLDDEQSMVDWISVALKQKNYLPVPTTDPHTALNLVKKEKIDCVISDIKMPDMDGFKFLREAKKIDSDLPVIFITAYGSMESAIEALRGGANDYLLKPFTLNELYQRLDAVLRPKKIKPVESSAIIGKSETIRKALELVDRVANTDATVLILGESGTGKELFAKEIHQRSNRSSKPFITLSCAAVPETLLESELFGYKKGAFTGAHQDKEGLLLAADQGSFFLDEIGDAPASIQMKILRLLQEKEIVPLGSTTPIKVDVRLIAATNKNLEEEVARGKFREDLYFRINVFPILLPPLRERVEDIPILAEHFLKNICQKMGIKEKTFAKETIKALKEYHWPGNIRELENVVERMAILCDKSIITPQFFPSFEPKITTSSLAEIEYKEITKTLKIEKGNVVRAAHRLGMHPSTLYRKLKMIRKG
ncbi:MAG: sigma-54 dependent transcriptional regulator, partial [candidate division WOR-3 bacterium]